MAVYTIVADLNGGDAVTAENDRIVKIYDASDDSLIETTGSHTTDGDVTVSGDSVTITNVTSTATSFKISAVDGAANESVLSDAYSLGYSYDFAGSTLDSDWTKVNPNTASVVLNQSDGLKATSQSTTASTNRADHIEHNKVFSTATFEFDYTQPTHAAGGGVVLWDGTKFAGVIMQGSAPNEFIRTYSSDDTGQTTAVAQAGKRYRFIFDGSQITIGYSSTGGAPYTDIETLARRVV